MKILNALVVTVLGFTSLTGLSAEILTKKPDTTEVRPKKAKSLPRAMNGTYGFGSGDKSMDKRRDRFQIDFINEEPVKEIHYLWIASSFASNWGYDVLGSNEVLRPSEFHTFNLFTDCSTDEGSLYDVRVAFPILNSEIYYYESRNAILEYIEGDLFVIQEEQEIDLCRRGLDSIYLATDRISW